MIGQSLAEALGCQPWPFLSTKFNDGIWPGCSTGCQRYTSNTNGHVLGSLPGHANTEEQKK